MITPFSLRPTSTLLLTIAMVWAATLLCSPSVAWAATANSGATLQVDTFRLISVTPSGTMSFTPPSGNPFASETEVTTLSANVKANNSYRLLVRAYKNASKDASTSWAATNGRTTKPLSDLKCNDNGLSPSSDFIAVSNGTPTSSSGVTHSLDFKVALSFQNDGPTNPASNASYTAVVVITVTN